MTLSHIRNKNLQKMDSTTCTNTTTTTTKHRSTWAGFDRILVDDHRRTGSLDEQLKHRHSALIHVESKPPSKKESTKDSGISFLLDKLSCRCEDGVVIEDVPTSKQYVTKMEMESLIDYDSDPEYRHPLPIKKSSQEDMEMRSETSDEWPIDEQINDTIHGELENVYHNNVESTLQVLKSHGVFLHLCTPSNTDRQNNDNNWPRRTCLLVKLWMEMGHHSGDVTIHPKLVWRSGFNRLSQSQQEDLGHRSILPIPQSTGTIDLLDIIRIISSPDFDREAYPFVSKRNCFMIVTTTTSFLLEALTSSEKEPIVSAMKILVARFVSMITCQEVRLIDEFFLPFGMTPR